MDAPAPRYTVPIFVAISSSRQTGPNLRATHDFAWQTCKSAKQGQHLDATPKVRAQQAAAKRLPDFKHLPSYVGKIN